MVLSKSCALTLEECIRLWISLFAHSPRTRLAWKELTGRAMSTYSKIRWWSRWEVCNQVLWQFGDVLPFSQPPIRRPVFHSCCLKSLLRLQVYHHLQILVHQGSPTQCGGVSRRSTLSSGLQYCNDDPCRCSQSRPAFGIYLHLRVTDQ